MTDMQFIAVSLLLLVLASALTLGLAVATWGLAARTADQADWLAQREFARLMDAQLAEHAAVDTDDLDALNQTLGGDT